VLLLTSHYNIDLPTARSQRPEVALDPEKEKLRDVAKVKPHATPVRTSILANLVPYNVRLVGESPRLHDVQGLKKKGVGAPQVKVALRQGKSRDWKAGDLLERERLIAVESLVLRPDLACSVGKPPRRVHENRSVLTMDVACDLFGYACTHRARSYHIHRRDF